MLNSSMVVFTCERRKHKEERIKSRGCRGEERQGQAGREGSDTLTFFSSLIITDIITDIDIFPTPPEGFPEILNDHPTAIATMHYPH